MAVASASVQERRHSPRREGSPSPSMAIQLLQAQHAVPADSINFSDRGLCLRIHESVEVRSRIRLQLTPGAGPRRPGRPLRCDARVSWIVQRLDLRAGPPFLFDVGVELIDPPPPLRRMLALRGGAIAESARSGAAKKWLTPAQVRGHEYLPRLERSKQPGQRWRLVVSVEGIPCFSEHYPSEQAAALGWARFKRRQAKR